MDTAMVGSMPQVYGNGQAFPPGLRHRGRAKSFIAVSTEIGTVCKYGCLWSIIDQCVQNLVIAAPSSWMFTA